MLTYRHYAFVTLLLAASNAEGLTRHPIVADSLTHEPLANASVFGHNGVFIGTSGLNGSITCAAPSDYPITVRYMGYRERTVEASTADTVFMQESMTELPEVTVSSRRKRMLHVLAYVREYSTLSTYTDTVAMFREKMVDFMLPDDRRSRYRGWRNPRVLNAKSYYRFSNSSGLDSVSDRCNHHFTWADWVGILPPVRVPAALVDSGSATYTSRGKYSQSESWVKSSGKIAVDIDILADTANRRWAPDFHYFFKTGVEFELFKLRLNYANASDSLISPIDLTGYSFNIESRGRARGMFLFNRPDEPFFVTTYSEVYVLDKEFIPISEAKRWERNKPAGSEIGIYESPDAPRLHPDILRLIARVDGIEHDQVRLNITPDSRLAGQPAPRRNFGQEVLQRLKGMFGIDNIAGKKKQEKHWRDFRRKRVNRNKPNETDNRH